jgi:hypothetical protein
MKAPETARSNPKPAIKLAVIGQPRSDWVPPAAGSCIGADTAVATAEGSGDGKAMGVAECVGVGFVESVGVGVATSETVRRQT